MKPLPKDANPLSLVYETMEYDWFSFLEHNRKTDHVNALIASFKERDVPNAILCNENGQIIDGQNRFLARKELGLPILFYCIESLRIDDVAFLNTYGKNWSISEYLDMWAGLGVEEYVKVKEFKSEYPELNIYVCIALLTNVLGSNTSVGVFISDNASGKKVTVGSFRSGKFVIGDYARAKYYADSIMRYKLVLTQNNTQIHKESGFAYALMAFLREENFDNEEMVRRAQQYRDMFYKCSSTQGYRTMLLNLWNYRRAQSHRATIGGNIKHPRIIIQ